MTSIVRQHHRFSIYGSAKCLPPLLTMLIYVAYLLIIVPFPPFLMQGFKIITQLSEGFSTGSVMRKVGFSGSSV